MGALNLSPGPLPAPAWWSVLTDALGCSTRLSRAFWEAFAASADPAVKALRYRCDHLEGHALLRPPLDQVTGGRMQTDFLRQAWRPYVVGTVLETLFHEKRLSRQDATTLQDRFLSMADKDGNWLGLRPGRRPRHAW